MKEQLNCKDCIHRKLLWNGYDTRSYCTIEQSGKTSTGLKPVTLSTPACENITRKEKPARSSGWTPEEEKQLLMYKHTGFTFKEISILLRRTEMAVYQKHRILTKKTTNKQ